MTKDSAQRAVYHTNASANQAWMEACSMEDFSIGEMQQMQKALQEKYRHKWEPICPDVGKISFFG